QIFAGLRQALSIGVILMVISEMFAASNGLGFAVVQFQRGFAIPEMWSGILLLGLLGVLLALAFRVVERRALAWYHGLRRSRRASCPATGPAATGRATRERTAHARREGAAEGLRGTRPARRGGARPHLLPGRR